VLAGGRGSRIGGDKAVVMLGGRPLIEYPLAAVRQAGLEAVVVAKRTTRLPPLDVPILLEPDEPTHPLLGVITALDQYPAVIALPCDMPFVASEQLSALAASAAHIVVLGPDQPFPALYRASALPQLRAALEACGSMRSTQAQSAVAPVSTAATRESGQLTVNTPEDLAAAELLLSRRR
jgi:molybdenum cofactor guanylyltransferase